MILRISSERIVMSKVGKTIINYNPFHVGSKKFGELCFANNRVILAHIDQSKWTFFGRLHFGH